jgi:hypothetical protein
MVQIQQSQSDEESEAQHEANSDEEMSDDEDEEAEYIPRSTSEKSDDHFIDENVESE